jgi:uncharacterized tellurite resistance protein B-like protein
MALLDVYMGLGSVVYALAKTDGCLQPEETETVRGILSQYEFGDLALHAYDVKESYDVSVPDAYEFALRRFAANRLELNDSLKKQFITVLEAVAEAHGGTSRKEAELIRQFRRDLRRL